MSKNNEVSIEKIENVIIPEIKKVLIDHFTNDIDEFTIIVNHKEVGSDSVLLSNYMKTKEVGIEDLFNNVITVVLKDIARLYDNKAEFLEVFKSYIGYFVTETIKHYPEDFKDILIVEENEKERIVQ